MSLNEEQIDAFTIAIEQELTDEEFVGSKYTHLIIDGVAGLDTEAQQAEFLKIAVDLGILFSGGVVKSREERQAAEREALRKEEEARIARREERQRLRQEEEARQASLYAQSAPTYGSPFSEACWCSDPNCQIGGPTPPSFAEPTPAYYYPEPPRSATFVDWQPLSVREGREPRITRAVAGDAVEAVTVPANSISFDTVKWDEPVSRDIPMVNAIRDEYMRLSQGVL